MRTSTRAKGLLALAALLLVQRAVASKGRGAASRGAAAAAAAEARRRLQDSTASTSVCTDNSRWQGLPWVYLTYNERNAWGSLGWSEQWWDNAWGASTTAKTQSGRCFGNRYLIGESGLDTCLVGAQVLTREDCLNASASYERTFPGDLLPLGASVNDNGGTPACNIQDRVGFQFNQARITGGNRGYSPVCKFGPDVGGACPQIATTPLPNNLTFASTIPRKVITCYGDLSADEQDAVRFLGYTPASWQACMKSEWNPPTCSWPAGIPTPQAPCLDQMIYLQSKYNNSKPWAILTSYQKAALIDLGWDTHGVQWESTDLPVTYAKPFDSQPPPQGLTRKERQAATFLGYTAQVWEGCYPQTECLTRLALMDKKIASWRWRTTMPAGIRARLLLLGWTEDLWYDGEPPALYRSSWDDLPYPQSVSARLVGYTKDTWEQCTQSNCVTRYNYILNKYDALSWAQMTGAQRDAWTVLQNGQVLWDAGGMLRTPLMRNRWQELTPEQQRQATFLGWDEGTWQGCNLGWSTTPSNVTNNTVYLADPTRTVRVRMTIQAPYTDITGNVYGQQVGTLPTSFIVVFERSVARALFCGNPVYRNYTRGAVGSDGQPLCMLPDSFNREQMRIRVLSVQPGSIIVDFLIVANQTAADDTSPYLFGALQRQLLSLYSPISQDPEFMRYAGKASIQEVPLSSLNPTQTAQALAFEQIRSQYNADNACNLQRDARIGTIRCGSHGSPRCGLQALGLSVLVALLHMLAGGLSVQSLS